MFNSADSRVRQDPCRHERKTPRLFTLHVEHLQCHHAERDQQRAAGVHTSSDQQERCLRLMKSTTEARPVRGR